MNGCRPGGTRCSDMLLNWACENENMRHAADVSTLSPIGVMIVLYNKRCSASSSVVSFVLNRPQIFVLADNSTDSAIIAYNREYCRTHAIEYCGMDGNQGLPKAYNAGIKIVGFRAEYLMILDDDTEIPENCLQILADAIQKNPDADLYLPFVYDAKGLLSPSRRVQCVFLRLRKPPVTFSPKMSAINSGLVIHLRAEAMDEPLFDEMQFLDCVDHLFVFKQIRNAKNIQLYSAEFRQSFFDLSQEDRDLRMERTLSRFKFFSKDYVYFCSACSLNMALARLYLIFRAIKLNLRFRTTRFFHVL